MRKVIKVDVGDYYPKMRCPKCKRDLRSVRRDVTHTCSYCKHRFKIDMPSVTVEVER